MSLDAPPKLEFVKQEEEYLRKVHPTPEDVPGCMKLFDDFLLCNGPLCLFRPQQGPKFAHRYFLFAQ